MHKPGKVKFTILWLGPPQSQQTTEPSEGLALELGRAKGGGGKTYRKAKPREDGQLETIFRDTPKAVSE